LEHYSGFCCKSNYRFYISDLAKKLVSLFNWVNISVNCYAFHFILFRVNAHSAPFVFVIFRPTCFSRYCSEEPELATSAGKTDKFAAFICNTANLPKFALNIEKYFE